MELIEYEESGDDGSLKRLEDLAKPIDLVTETGSENVPNPEAARKYAAFLESMLDSMAFDLDEEEFLAA